MPSNCFDAKLTGENEVPSKDTQATGFVELIANNGNSSMGYTINVTNIEKDDFRYTYTKEK